MMINSSMLCFFDHDLILETEETDAHQKSCLDPQRCQGKNRKMQD